MYSWERKELACDELTSLIESGPQVHETHRCSIMRYYFYQDFNIIHECESLHYLYLRVCTSCLVWTTDTQNLYLSILILFLNGYNMLHYLDSLKVEEWTLDEGKDGEVDGLEHLEEGGVPLGLSLEQTSSGLSNEVSGTINPLSIVISKHQRPIQNCNANIVPY